MNTLSNDVTETTRNMESLIFHKISRKTRIAVAIELNISEPTMCRYMGTENETGMIRKMTNLLEVLGIRLVTQSVVVADSGRVRATELLACEYLQQRIASDKERDFLIASLKKEIAELNKELDGYKKKPLKDLSG